MLDNPYSQYIQVPHVHTDYLHKILSIQVTHSNMSTLHYWDLLTRMTY